MATVNPCLAKVLSHQEQVHGRCVVRCVGDGVSVTDKLQLWMESCGSRLCLSDKFLLWMESFGSKQCLSDELLLWVESFGPKQYLSPNRSIPNANL